MRNHATPHKINKQSAMNNTMIEYNEGHHTYYVYIITNKYRSTFYIGMTNNLGLRLQQHKENIEKGIKTFATKYNIEFLVYYEKFTWIEEAIAREKEIKGWRRDKKIELIKLFNDNFEFLNSKFIKDYVIPPASE
jgi:putative endonuclease